MKGRKSPSRANRPEPADVGREESSLVDEIKIDEPHPVDTQTTPTTHETAELLRVHVRTGSGWSSAASCAQCTSELRCDSIRPTSRR